jgi:preprotein translocase subunit YajC
MIVIAYMFIFRPSIKKRKEAKKFKENLKAGQKVVTIGGIHGKILEISETTVLIQSEGSKLRLEISAITSSVEEQLTVKS